MTDDLEASVTRALHDGRLDLSLEFQQAPDGAKSGSIAISRRAHRPPRRDLAVAK